jgi:hypothetical protein
MGHLLFSSLASPKANTGLVRLCLRGSLVEDVRKGPGHPCVLGDGFSLDQFGLGGAGGAFYSLDPALEDYYSSLACLTGLSVTLEC